MIKLYQKPIPTEDFKPLCEQYSEYIKVVVDLENGWLCAGGEYHIDCEEVLINNGSKQANLWGGGVDTTSSKIEYQAMSNFKPSQGRLTYEISDPDVKSRFAERVKYYFGL
jgi:hypothetical protein